MNPLHFDKESARSAYLDKDPYLNLRKLDLLLIRAELLSKNELFIKEWLEMKQQKEMDKMDENLEEAFFARWGMDFKAELYIETDPIVKVVDADRMDAYVTFKIDLRYPKNRIMAEIENKVSKWIATYKEEMELEKDIRNSGGFPHWLNDKADLTSKRYTEIDKLKGNIPSEIEDIRRNLKVWSMRYEKKLKWSEITKQLGLFDIQTAKNHARAVERLIKSGLPGFKPFPEE